MLLSFLSEQVAALSAAGQLTPQVADAALALLNLFKSRGVEAQLVTTMSMVTLEIGEALARQYAPPSTRLVQALAELDPEDEAELVEIKLLMAAAFAPGGDCACATFVDDVTFFLESLDESENAFIASVAEAVQSGSDAAFQEVKQAQEGRTQARQHMNALLQIARKMAVAAA